MSITRFYTPWAIYYNIIRLIIANKHTKKCGRIARARDVAISIGAGWRDRCFVTPARAEAPRNEFRLTL